MADKNYKVAYKCAWCGDSFHEVTDRRSMRPVAIYNDYKGRQFDSWFRLKMLNDNEEKDLLDIN